MTEKLIVTSAQYSDDRNNIIDATSNSKKVCVPAETGNRHYDAIQKWVAEGNTITPADSE